MCKWPSFITTNISYAVQYIDNSFMVVLHVYSKRIVYFMNLYITISDSSYTIKKFICHNKYIFSNTLETEYFVCNVSIYVYFSDLIWERNG